MELKIEIGTSIKADKPINFGSFITISLSTLNDCFVSSEGFINNKLYIQKFDSNNLYKNFASTIFKIMPLSEHTSFQAQMQLYSLTNNYQKKEDNFSELGITI